MSNNLGIPEVTLTEIIAGVDAVNAQGTLTVDVQVTATDTMTVGATVYEFLAGATAAAGKIGIGASEAACKLAIVAAINGTDGFNTANASVSAAAFVADDCVLTALVAGTAGNAIVTTETFTAAGTVFDAATIGTTTAGVLGINSINVDGRKNALTPLVVRVMGHDDDTGAEEDDPDLMALFCSKAQGHPWEKEVNNIPHITFEAADGTTACDSDATYIIPFLDYSTYE